VSIAVNGTIGPAPGIVCRRRASSLHQSLGEQARRWSDEGLVERADLLSDLAPDGAVSLEVTSKVDPLRRGSVQPIPSCLGTETPTLLHARTPRHAGGGASRH
jgi:hypothetical protein